MSGVLITGGAGFIGSHLAEHYAGLGEQVFIIDDLSTGSIKNLNQIRKLPNVHVVIDDVRRAPVLAELVDQADVVFHLAAAVGVRLVVESPVYTIENNIHGTEVVLSSANKKKKKVILASTSEVYGCSDKVPFNEGDFMIMGPPSRGRWSYACSKALDEFLALAYHKEKRLPVVIVRLFNTVGPRQTGRYGMVLPTFVRQALTGQDVTVFGDGNQSRCFTHVNDVVSALAALAKDDKLVGRTFNIGNDEEISMSQLADRVNKMAGGRSHVVKIPYSQAYEEGFDDMPRRVPSLAAIKEAIGYMPKYNLDQIIQSVFKYYQSGDDNG